MEELRKDVEDYGEYQDRGLIFTDNFLKLIDYLREKEIKTKIKNDKHFEDAFVEISCKVKKLMNLSPFKTINHLITILLVMTEYENIIKTKDGELYSIFDILEKIKDADVDDLI